MHISAGELYRRRVTTCHSSCFTLRDSVGLRSRRPGPLLLSFYREASFDDRRKDSRMDRKVERMRGKIIAAIAVEKSHAKTTHGRARSALSFLRGFRSESAHLTRATSINGRAVIKSEGMPGTATLFAAGSARRCRLVSPIRRLTTPK